MLEAEKSLLYLKGYFLLEGLGSQLEFPFRHVEPMQETCLN